jgi:hypothetical protein
MTKENWLNIALIVSNFIAVLMGPILAARMMMSRNDHPSPNPNPDVPNPKQLSGWMRWLISWPVQLGLPLSIVLLNVYYLRKNLLSAAPLTREAVFTISLEVAAIWFGIVSGMFDTVTGRLWKALVLHMDLFDRHATQSDRVLKIVENLSDQVSALSETQSAITKTMERTELAKPPARRTQGTLGVVVTLIRAII